MWTNKKNGWSLGTKMMIWQWSKWKPRFDITKMQENNKKGQNNFCTVLYSISKQSGYNHKGTSVFFSIFAFLIVFLLYQLWGFLYCIAEAPSWFLISNNSFWWWVPICWLTDRLDRKCFPQTLHVASWTINLKYNWQLSTCLRYHSRLFVRVGHEAWRWHVVVKKLWFPIAA